MTHPAPAGDNEPVTWIAVRSRDEARVRRVAPLRAPLERGTLMLEVELPERGICGQPVVHCANGADARAFSVSFLPDGGLALVHRRGDRRIALSLSGGDRDYAGPRHVSYVWDTASDTACLTVEELDTGRVLQRRGHGPLPLLPDEIDDLCAAAPAGRMSAVAWVAVGSGRHPVASAQGMAGATPVRTPTGTAPLCTLKPGDLVAVGGGRAARLGSLAQVRVPPLGRFCPVRLLAPYYGRQDDIVVAPGQRVALSGADTEYLFDAEGVLVEARLLVDGITAVWDRTDGVQTWYTPLFDDHHLLSADGCDLASAFLGRLADSPEVAATTAFAALAAAGRLPRHRRRIRRELCGWEATALLDARRRQHAPFAA